MALILKSSLLCLCLALLYQGGLCNQSNSVENDISSGSSEESDIGKRIYGGLSRQNNDYDYVAQLTINFLGSPSLRCSGVVLTDRIVLTVAHCLSPPGRQRAFSVWVKLPRGGLYLFEQNEILIHPLFNRIYGNDVAILRKDTRGRTYMRNYGNPPKLPEPNTDYDNAEAVIAGWGRTTDNISSFRFQYAEVTVMNDTDCKNKYPRLLGAMEVNDNFLCTYNSLAGICEGDWGGPLMIKREGFLELAGLSMFTEKANCGSNDQRDSPSTYYMLWPALAWVKNTFII